MPAFMFADGHSHLNARASNRKVKQQSYKYAIPLPFDWRRKDGSIKTGGFIREDGYREWADDHHSNSHEAYDQTVFLIRDPADLYDITRYGLLRDYHVGCIYTRLLSSGMNNCRSDSEVIETFERNTLATIKAIRDVRWETGIRRGTGIDANLCVAGKVHLEDGPQRAQRLLDAVEYFQKKHPEDASFLTGFDLAGNEQEKHADLKEFTGAFERAHRSRKYGGLGLDNSCHAVETEGPEYGWIAVNLPGVKAVSHFLNAVQDPLLIEEAKNRGLLIEQLFISNGMLHESRYPKLANHPAPDFYKAGLFLGLGTDDPGMQHIPAIARSCAPRAADLGTHIGDEYAIAAKWFNRRQRLEFTANTIRLGFAPRDARNDPTQNLLDRVCRFAHDHHIPMRPELFVSPHVRQRTVSYSYPRARRVLAA